jgi:starch phosphorylase
MGAFNGLDREQMHRLGGDPFGMTVAALRMARMSNGVAQLHGETARRMWKDVNGASPLIAITNGVHTRTWWDTRIKEAYKQGQDLWEPHMAAKQELIKEIQNLTGVALNPQALLIGFARRAAPYKRSDFIFRQPEIIEPLLREGKIQLVFAGKAHPNDDMGKSIISNLYAASRRYPKSVVFLQNYDINIGRMLTCGTDVWLNNPRRPQEASGTSGMKAAMNGVLNVSVLDGWWPEGCEHGVTGWQIGNAYEGPDQDQHDLQSMYQVLLDEVLPTFYHDRNQWTQMMKNSIDMSHHKFSAERMVQEYYGRLYTLAEEAWLQTAAGK